MQPTIAGNLLDIIDLARTLRQEQLFIQHEQITFANLTDTLTKSSCSVSELAWICAQQTRNLNDLIITRPESGPAFCCQKASKLENTKFQEAHKIKNLKYQNVLTYIELFNYLYRSPYLIAQILGAGDRIKSISSDQMNSMIYTLTTGLYGNLIHSKDIEMVLKVLRELIEIQIVPSEFPRRVLRTGSSAFARLFYRLHESLFSAKTFLTAALHKPIMKVLIESENMLDIDSNKSIMNFSAKERLKRFGLETSVEYKENIRKYRNETVNQLHLLANEFIQSLTQCWSIFPSTLRWLIQTVFNLLKQAHFDDKVVNEILTDMVFTHFICPAVVSPDLFGICDVSISEQARFNLIQIGQILQMMSLMNYEDVDPKFDAVHEKFESNMVAELLKELIINDTDLSIGIVAVRTQQTEYERVNLLVTQNELNNFVNFIRIVLDWGDSMISDDDRQKLAKILDELPFKYDALNIGDNLVQANNINDNNNKTKQSIINIGKSTKNKIVKSISLNVTNSIENDDIASINGNNVNGFNNFSNINSLSNDGLEQVLIFPIATGGESKFQLLTEAEVLKMNSIGQEITNNSVNLSTENMDKLGKMVSEFDNIDNVLRPVLKSTRFSVSHDDASIGNSDNLEAVSEAPSNHSVTSSLELEENDQNDNLSDMVSANVSGRGTPNISGRDTPSSQVTDGENIVNQIPTPQMAKIINKARSDIEDKFCKFEIKKLIEGDETVSIISDTWSTDVLASDSETVDVTERDRNFSTPLIPSAVVLPGDNNFEVLSNSRVLEASETRSESAWSTDVLASDSEKLAEVDTDDNLSITTKSDITDAGQSELDFSREIDTSAISRVQCPSNSPIFPQRANISSLPTPESPVYTSRSTENQFFVSNVADDDLSSFSSQISSLARSSTRTTNQYSGENSFQQNYKSGNERCTFLPIGGNRMRRQNSGESSVSNQSFSLDEIQAIKQKFEKDSEFQTKPLKDLIDFCEIPNDGTLMESENFDNLNHLNDGNVIHRRLSTEQRNAIVDGRRNGILETSGEYPRRHQSLNYENHVIISKNLNQRITSAPIVEYPKIEPNKSQENTIDDNLLQKTEDLTLTDKLPIQVILKPSRATGAIPKSISFDASADKTQHGRLNEPLRSNGSGFFNKIKQGFKNRKGNKGRINDEYLSRNVSFNCERIEFLECDMVRNRLGENGIAEMTEDILAKYRRKVSSSSETTNSESTGGSNSINRKVVNMEQRIPNGIHSDKIIDFLDAKKKIRSVFSSTDLHTCDFRHTTYLNASPLLTYLQIQLAQAVNLQNFEQMSYISEAIRCLTSLDLGQHQKLIEELQSDIVKRQIYIQYLIRYHQNLLLIIECIEQFEDRLQNDREVCNRHLIAMCVKIFIEKKESSIEKFQQEFSSLNVVDEKIDILQEFIGVLMNNLKTDGILQGMADWQLEEAKISIERILLQRFYRQIIFPNDDGDISRDAVLHDHIRKLQRVITPTHAALRISAEYLTGAPWPFAQQQLSFISAYITPQEKLKCVIRCISSIMSVLQMACDRVPSTDDLLPVLIYVVIKANPPYLLSTIQYINSFLGEKLDGKDLFYWTQFSSVVQFIKTMDYVD